VNIAVHFIRARSNLILKLLLWRIPYVHSLFIEKGRRRGRERQGVGGKGERGGRVVGTVIVVIIF